MRVYSTVDRLSGAVFGASGCPRWRRFWTLHWATMRLSMDHHSNFYAAGHGLAARVTALVRATAMARSFNTTNLKIFATVFGRVAVTEHAARYVRGGAFGCAGAAVVMPRHGHVFRMWRSPDTHHHEHKRMMTGKLACEGPAGLQLQRWVLDLFMSSVVPHICHTHTSNKSSAPHTKDLGRQPRLRFVTFGTHPRLGTPGRFRHSLLGMYT